MRYVLRWTAGALLALILFATPAGAQVSPDGDEAVRRVLDAYIKLYTRDTLAEWRTLFLPSFSAAFTNADGSITVRNLDEFYERQRGFFATGRRISEELQNVQIARQHRIASVRADFVLFEDDMARPGRLMMLLIEDRGVFKIQALVFTYHI